MTTKKAVAKKPEALSSFVWYNDDQGYSEEEFTTESATVNDALDNVNSGEEFLVYQLTNVYKKTVSAVLI